MNRQVLLDSLLQDTMSGWRSGRVNSKQITWLNQNQSWDFFTFLISMSTSLLRKALLKGDLISTAPQSTSNLAETRTSSNLLHSTSQLQVSDRSKTQSGSQLQISDRPRFWQFYRVSGKTREAKFLQFPFLSGTLFWHFSFL